VRFVPLIGTEGWLDEKGQTPSSSLEEMPLSELVYHYSEHFAHLEDASMEDLLERIGDSRVVLLGEATHGSSEFYDMRARITRELIEKKGFTVIAAEADWTDAAWFDHFIHGTTPEHRGHDTPFQRFPSWMWANRSVTNFMAWLKTHNASQSDPAQKVGFYGLDLYGMFSSIEAVLEYLEMVDPATAEVARLRYGCLMPWSSDPAMYGRVTLTGKYRECEQEVIDMLKDLHRKREEYLVMDGQRFFNAEQNARLIRNAEHYYRTIYFAEVNSWNLRDQHMFETLQAILSHRGRDAKAVIWAHNSHIGDARATSMSARGEWNIGQLVREKYGDKAYLIGFGTDHGTVAAASEWGGPMEVKQIRPAHMDSYERIFHEVHTDNFMLPLKEPLSPLIRKKLLPEKLERAIGVIYRPESELVSHYFYASLPRQFDEYIWFDETRAVEPLSREIDTRVMDTFPFGV
jgi:protein-L-isoaspartate(D-aspartate) O-methyltransferase